MKQIALKILSIITITLTAPIIAQDLPQPTNIQSPNAVSLGKYGDIPVSYYTGTPDISIPLYSLNDFGIPLNISMSYDGSGVRVNNVPGWVGQNWSLQSGGVITRTPKGKSVDEGWYSTSAGSFASYMSPLARSVLNNPNWNTEGFFHELQTVSGNLDTEPDVFTFNFMGHTGKFFMGVDGEWKVSSSSNLKIVIDPTENRYPFDENTVPFNNQVTHTAAQYPAHKSIYKITVVDDNANKFVFGNTDDSIEYSVAFMGQTFRQWHANSWYLTQVYDRFDNLIYSFDYDRGDYVAQFYVYERSEGWDTSDNSSGFNVSTCANNISQFGINQNSGIYGGDLISPVYLKKIETIRGNIDFNRTESYGDNYANDIDLRNYLEYFLYGTDVNSNPLYYYYLLPYINMNDALSKLRWPKLTSISGLNKNTDFTYNDVMGDTNNNRLFLMGLSIDEQNYSFEYNDLEQLPHYLSKAIDHWGYFRGNYNFYPSGNAWGSNNFNAYYNARNVSPIHAKKGSLTKMTYPTKGWTTFEWESNNYSVYVSDDKSSLVNSSNTYTGGIRIKRIRNNDGKGDEIIKEYKYVKNYDINQESTISSGILERKPKYYWTNFSFIGNQNNSYILDENLFSTIPSIPLSNASGTHIGYSEVIEILPNNGYKIYKYTSNENTTYRDEYNAYSLNPDLTPYAVYNDKSMLRGKLKGVDLRDSNNNLKRKTSRNYNFNNSLFVRGVNISVRNCNTIGVGFIKGSAYKRYYFDNNLVRQENITYENGEEMVNEVEYSYNYYPSTTLTNGSQYLESQKTQTYSLLGSSDEEYYQKDYTYTFEDPSTIYTDLTNQDYIGILETEVSKNGDLLSRQRVEYDYFGDNNSILPKQLLTGKANDDLEGQKVIDAYYWDNKAIEKFHTIGGNYTQLKYYRHLLNGSFTTLPYSMFRIEGEEITNTTYLDNRAYEINYTGLTHNQILSKQRLVRNYYSNHMVTSYTYYPTSWLLRTMTNPKGITEYYFYDSNERLIRIEDKDGNTLKQFYYNYAND
ncbi:MAG: hypothetical protein N4A76_00870 [Firmicutes bacterium]|jgi:YD repeat-containing protein|nr:hypothetical protein [Bacillota bacterium]